MRDYNNLSDSDIELIIKDGIKSEFWKWFSTGFEDQQNHLMQQIVSMRMTGWDDVVKIVNLIASYKTRAEIMNFPMTVLKQIEVERENNKK